MTAQKLWSDPKTEIMVFVDARNAFNELSRARSLMNVRSDCPDMAVLLWNLYIDSSELIFEDGRMLGSKEGCTQGCPLGMIS